MFFNDSVPLDVMASLADKARICPTPPGTGLLEGNTLVLRLPTGELKVSAPRRLLRKAFLVCDGTRSWRELLDQVKPAARDEFDRFLAFLFAQGALIDAVLLTRSSAPYAATSTPVGMGAGQALSRKIGARFIMGDVPALAPGPAGRSHAVPATPLDTFFEDRMSVRTFGDQEVTDAQLHALLWSAAGVVRRQHTPTVRTAPRRTLGSGGGMYLVQWIAVLKKAAGGYAPGVYEVQFPDERSVCLSLRTHDTQLFHRAFTRPWQQTFATGAIFAVARVDLAALRYCNRALQYLFLEVGAGLQNVALTAPALGLASAVIGGYSEEVVSSLCALDGEQVLCSAIFGSAPTAAQQRAEVNMPAIDFDWGDYTPQIYPLPFFAARARFRPEEGVEVNTWGTDADPWRAYVKSHAEAIERQGMREPRHIVAAPFADVDAAIDPSLIARYAQAQYRTANFPFARFDPTLAHQWVRGTELRHGRSVHVIASFIYRWEQLRQAYPGQPCDAPYTQANSSGCAAGPTLEFALSAALLEVIERDAFMRCWLTQRAGAFVPDLLLPVALLQRVRNLRESGANVTVQSLPSAAAWVAMVTATHRQKTFTCVTAAARFEMVDAVGAALNELELMFYSQLLQKKRDGIRPVEVRSPADHARLHCQPAYFQRANALLQPGEPLNEWPTEGKVRDLDSLVEALSQNGLQPVFIDITPEKNCIDQGRTPLIVVKAVVPTLLPISFGYGLEPRGMLDGVSKRSFFPHPFP